MTLYEIASLILQLSKKPISRVRFAKMIYFVHKELVRKKFADFESIAYLRLPLGPVPENFTSLTQSPDITLQHIPNAPLSYETEEFFVPNPTPPKGLPKPLLTAVERTIAALDRHTTAELVAASHDPSWHAHFNGETYYPNPADLRNSFPFTPLAPLSPILVKIRLKRPSSNEIGALQAALLRGMLSDIVKESTDLEYPDDETGKNDQAGKDDKVSKKDRESKST